MRALVFDRWLTISRHVARTYRVAVWRRIRRASRRADLWSEAERAALREAEKGI